ncbi:hypothetical protein P8C59_004489 [Phyllachora maydis]|nr:hypothetical protein P8C59_004489 [Phyllachora maydis]
MDSDDLDTTDPIANDVQPRRRRAALALALVALVLALLSAASGIALSVVVVVVVQLQSDAEPLDFAARIVLFAAACAALVYVLLHAVLARHAYSEAESAESRSRWRRYVARAATAWACFVAALWVAATVLRTLLLVWTGVDLSRGVAGNVPGLEVLVSAAGLLSSTAILILLNTSDRPFATAVLSPPSLILGRDTTEFHNDHLPSPPVGQPPTKSTTSLRRTLTKQPRRALTTDAILPDVSQPLTRPGSLDVDARITRIRNQDFPTPLDGIFSFLQADPPPAGAALTTTSSSIAALATAPAFAWLPPAAVALAALRASGIAAVSQPQSQHISRASPSFTSDGALSTVAQASSPASPHQHQHQSQPQQQQRQQPTIPNLTAFHIPPAPVGLLSIPERPSPSSAPSASGSSNPDPDPAPSHSPDSAHRPRRWTLASISDLDEGEPRLVTTPAASTVTMVNPLGVAGSSVRHSLSVTVSDSGRWMVRPVSGLTPLVAGTSEIPFALALGVGAGPRRGSRTAAAAVMQAAVGRRVALAASLKLLAEGTTMTEKEEVAGGMEGGVGTAEEMTEEAKRRTAAAVVMQRAVAGRLMSSGPGQALGMSGPR